MIVYRVFETPYNKYLYDRNQNAIVRISDAEYELLNKGDVENSLLGSLKERGFLLESIIKEIEHPFTDRVDYYTDKRLFQMILQVTQCCNLRCSYCAYSGEYEHRGHSNANMSWDVAKKAIDMFVQRSRNNKIIALGFYGGEPLLRFELIKQCVAYLKEQVPDKELIFTMTTNGTLFTREIAEYLSKDKWKIVISVDGSQKDYDKNRKFADGSGSFDIIMKNVKEVKELFPELVKNITFNAVLNVNSNYNCVRDYFETSDVVCDSDFMLNTVVTENRKDKNLMFGTDYFLGRYYDYYLMLMNMIGKCRSEYVPKSLKTEESQIINFYKSLHTTEVTGRKCHHSGPCIPGKQRLFVSTEGKLYPCEKVPESHDMEIGNLDEGFDLNKVRKILNIGALSEKKCLQCWAIHHCKICVNNCVCEGKLSANEKVSYCKGSQEFALERLKQICLLKELKYDFGRYDFEENSNISNK